MKAGDKAMDRSEKRDTKGLKTYWAFSMDFCHVTVTLFFLKKTVYIKFFSTNH